MHPRTMRLPPPLPHPIPGTPTPRTVLLLNPFYPKDPESSFGKHVLTPSLALPTLAGATPAPWRVTCWDENLLQGPPPTSPIPEVVGITVHLTFAERAWALARLYRALGSRVVVGGPHVQACPEEAAPHADAVSSGDGAATWPRILADVAAGRLQASYDAPFRGYPDQPWPDRAILPPWAFLTPASLVATRGCHNRCDFCHLATRGMDVRREQRPPEDVAAEFRATGAPYGVFVDNNLGADRAYLHALCRALEPLDRIWSAAVTLDVTDDPSLVETMARAGCTGVFVGLESLTDANLRDAGKRCPRAEEYAARVERFQRVGIQVNGSFVVGFDHDDDGVFDRIVDWVEATRLACATYHILTPYPGTPLFRRMEAEGRLLHRDWSRYDTAHCVFRPARMSPETLEAGRALMYRRTFGARSIWRRRPSDPGAIPAYLGMSVLYKKLNPLWPLLVRHRLVHAAWAPLVEASRARHARWRTRRSADDAAPAVAWRAAV